MTSVRQDHAPAAAHGRARVRMGAALGALAITATLLILTLRPLPPVVHAAGPVFEADPRALPADGDVVDACGELVARHLRDGLRLQQPGALQVLGIGCVVVAGVGAERRGHRADEPARLDPLGG